MPLLRRVAIIGVLIYIVLWLAYRYQQKRLEYGRPEHVQAYVEAYGHMAAEVGRSAGVPPAIILAAGGLESGWGSSELAREGRNFFGIKSRASDEPRYCLPTREFVNRKAYTINACFKAYASPRDSFQDYVDHLRNNQRYRELFSYDPQDYHRWAEGLQRIGYATDPEYASKLIRLVQQYGLYLE